MTSSVRTTHSTRASGPDLGSGGMASQSRTIRWRPEPSRRHLGPGASVFIAYLPPLSLLLDAAPMVLLRALPCGQR